MQFSKFEYDFNSFWLVCPRQTAMLFAAENSVTAFIDKMWADRIESFVQCLVPTLLLGKKDHGSEILLLSKGQITVFLDCLFDVSPDIRCIISVEVDYGFW